MIFSSEIEIFEQFEHSSPVCSRLDFIKCYRTKKIGEEFVKAQGKLEKHSRIHNSYFLKAIKVSHADVILPAINKKEYMIINSSEIRAIAFMLGNLCQDGYQNHRNKSNPLAST